MSARATRPRSRRGRHAPPGELDPVAESSEEVEAASGTSKPRPALPPQSSGPELLGSIAEVSGQDLGSWTDKETDGGSGRGQASLPEGPHEPEVEAHQAPEAALQDRESVPSGMGTPDVFQTLQNALSSLEAAAAVWRHRPPSCPGKMEVEDRSKGVPGPLGKQEAARGCEQEAASLAERNTWLRLALGSREDELVRMQASLQAIWAEKETLQREVQELQDSLSRLEPFPPPSHSQVSGSGSGSSCSGADREPWGTQDSISLAYPLLWHLQSDSSTQILGSPPSQLLSPKIHIMETQMEQLQGSIGKLKCFNRLLSAVLQGYKGRCEGLSMQLSQREAEATALRLALQYSEQREEAYGVLLALCEANSGAGEEALMADLQAAEKEAWRVLAREKAATDGGTLRDPQPSPEGSSVDKPTPQEVAIQLQDYIQRLQERHALVKIPPEPGPTVAPVPRAEAMVQAILGTQPGPALPRLEKTQIQKDFVATRETLADVMLRLQLVRREKRGLELREAALRAQRPVHMLLLEQLQWERAQLQAGGANSSGGDSSRGGSSGDEEEWSQGPPAVLGGSSGIDGGQVGKIRDPEKLVQELAASLTRSLGLQEELQSLREKLEQMAQKGRARQAQNAELNSDLCKAHSALVLAFRGAHRKQEEQRRKLEQQMALLETWQAKELVVLEATARALGKPRSPRPPPRLGETFL
ncbi:harmonin-binding protein USHBP1 [Nycticebus coucang]|uniref:harmonin-binding protein USHBP1 n=1 Tax=Nycticebus coucang TaxID=9470 RepID=UPI00234D3860|nr:harmonin-binding protein USHBP1 [Nycticebus coucang]XP_053442405.1 harmonin-binding protein USHBP1 [Nycticebus coucang]